MAKVSVKQVRSLVGKDIVTVLSSGAKVSGRLERVDRGRLYVIPAGKGKKVRVKALLPLLLYDLLAIGAQPYGGAGYGYGAYGGYPNAYAGYPYGGGALPYGGYPYGGAVHPLYPYSY
ncbi:hypothetical protein [Paenibacillus tarimensis]|uniref:hypothetical protein n=1 Tax=Paenibacillus tarimensis TaxID=416012 RepID=UPI001F31F496|nr:hypothetical protein [Paenibacillus tarimensis]MCF2942838.1 hypothetical protein [Paenibacillus tarimensis]